MPDDRIRLVIPPEWRERFEAAAQQAALPLPNFIITTVAQVLQARSPVQNPGLPPTHQPLRTLDPEAMPFPPEAYEARGINPPSTPSSARFHGLVPMGSGEPCRHEARKKIRRHAGTNNGEKYCPSCGLVLEKVTMCPVVDHKGPCKLAIGPGHQVCPNHAAKHQSTAPTATEGQHIGHDVQQVKRGKEGVPSWHCETCSEAQNKPVWLESKETALERAGGSV